MKKLIAITIVSVLFAGSVFGSEALNAKDCKSTQSSQARVAGKDIAKLAQLAEDYVDSKKKAQVTVE
ncbi:MAG: hypothetical protein KAG61_06010 [Bacteriovoracaceae bacterium]|nr:hypothetical protein [Bacteriovoracaceae bacterium]